MSGIAKAAQKRQEEKTQQAEGRNWQLFLKDGDIALMAIIPSGDDNDNRFESDFYTHTISYTGNDGSSRFRLAICDKKTLKKDCPYCGPKMWPKHNFVFWAYVNFIWHPKQTNEAWEAVVNKLGQTMYKENVGDFRVFMQGWGQKDYLFNQIFDIFTENGALNKFLIRIKRTGSGMNDTSYNIVMTQNQVVFDEDTAKKAKNLPNVRDFVFSKFAPREEVEGISLSDEKTTTKSVGTVLEEDDFPVSGTVATKLIKTADEIVNPLKGRGRPKKGAEEKTTDSWDEVVKETPKKEETRNELKVKTTESITTLMREDLF